MKTAFRDEVSDLLELYDIDSLTLEQTSERLRQHFQTFGRIGLGYEQQLIAEEIFSYISKKRSKERKKEKQFLEDILNSNITQLIQEGFSRRKFSFIFQKNKRFIKFIVFLNIYTVIYKCLNINVKLMIQR